MFCPRCGSRLPDGAKFCASCGTQLGEKSVGPAPAPAPAPQPKRRRRAPVVAAVIALVALLAGGGVAAWWFLLRPKPVYVCTKSEYVLKTSSSAGIETFMAGALVPSSVCCNIYIVPGLDTSNAFNWENDYSERGALMSRTQTFALMDGAQSETYGYGLDECGNTSSRSMDGVSVDITYDDQQRPVVVSGLGGGRTTYSYGDDGSYSYVTVDEDGGVLDRAQFGSDGKMVSRVTSYDSPDATLELSYEDGFLTNASWVGSDGTVEAQVTGTLRRDGQGRVAEVALSASGDTSRASIFGLDYYDRICFEYDENGNISRCYAPWKSPDAWQVFSDGDTPGVPDTENVYDYRLEYERIDNPTPLVRLLGGKSLLS
ncbi:zinc ribbon domain-containing protein [Olsenella uli]|uniref:zinc ribbon domain-containing protein n=1 Tax=Olsenella uli TaxID=133926 RepID=UPI001959BB1A|nr:zinc ribbon domain-containing protein [Olsenella uli]MBM6676606.1 zinc ribbon domain-containing protein [Olsenella uli]